VRDFDRRRPPFVPTYRKAQPPRWLPYLALFGSLGTLLCCAVPSLLVLAGLGATVAAVVSASPWLVALSHNKATVFAVSAVLIALNFAYVYSAAPRLRAAGASCPSDEAGACGSAARLSRGVLWLSAALHGAGFFVAYWLGPLLTRFAR
jgi:hypothetical protein